MGQPQRRHIIEKSHPSMDDVSPRATQTMLSSSDPLPKSPDCACVYARVDVGQRAACVNWFSSSIRHPQKYQTHYISLFKQTKTNLVSQGFQSPRAMPVIASPEWKFPSLRLGFLPCSLGGSQPNCPGSSETHTAHTQAAMHFPGRNAASHSPLRQQFAFPGASAAP